jgi:hypothetical protein
VLAEVDDSVSAELLDHPPVGRQVVVGRRQVRVVIYGDRVLPEPPRRLDTDEDVAEAKPATTNSPPSTYNSPGGGPQCSSTLFRRSSGSSSNHNA